MLTLSSVDNLVSFANRKITVWLSFEERMNCLLFVHVIHSCKGRVGVTGISLIQEIIKVTLMISCLILDWENGIYSLGLDLATGNGMNNYKMGMGFLFFSGLCSNILK